MKKIIYIVAVGLMLGMALSPSSLFAWANGECALGCARHARRYDVKHGEELPR